MNIEQFEAFITHAQLHELRQLTIYRDTLLQTYEQSPTLDVLARYELPKMIDVYLTYDVEDYSASSNETQTIARKNNQLEKQAQALWQQEIAKLTHIIEAIKKEQAEKPR